MLALSARNGLRVLVAKIALHLRALLLRLADAFVPVELPLYELTAGVARTQIVATFASLRVSEALQDGCDTLAALSRQTGTKPDLLERFLAAACTLGLIARHKGGRYQPTRMTRALVTRAPGSLAAFAHYMASDSNAQAWSGLTGVLKSGQDAFTTGRGKDIWSHFAAHPDEEATFAAAMGELAHLDGPAVAKAYPFGRHACICDVGGGQGTFLAAILAAHPTVRGVVFDRPAVVDGRPQRSHRRDLRFVAGDFFAAVPSGADAYVLRHILHDWPDPICEKILTNIRAALPLWGRLLIVDSCVERARPERLGAMKDLTMAVACGGRERDTVAIHALLSASNLTLVRRWQTATMMSVWEAAPAVDPRPPARAAQTAPKRPAQATLDSRQNPAKPVGVAR